MTGSVQTKTIGNGKRAIAGAGLAMGIAVLLSGCNSAPKIYEHGDRAPGILKPVPPPQQTGDAGAAAAPVVAGNCPVVSLRDGTSFLRKYAKGTKDDPSKLMFQASLADTTRQCALANGVFTITVQAQGRIVAGPMGKAGAYPLPIRVAVLDGDNTLYTNLVKFNAELPPGQPANQFLFTKNDIAVPGGVGPTARIFLGFDEGPYNTK